MPAKTLCEWKSGEEHEPELCEECGKIIPVGGDVHFLADGGYSPDGVYVGTCCIGLFTNEAK